MEEIYIKQFKKMDLRIEPDPSRRIPPESSMTGRTSLSGPGSQGIGLY
jgi:hypothetical protein